MAIEWVLKSGNDYWAEVLREDRNRVRVMPRYDFHVLDDDVSVDALSAEFEKFDHVLDHAQRLAASLLIGNGLSSCDPSALEVRVTDELGRKVLSLPVSTICVGSG
jgi:hypothetical protein